MHCYAAKSVYIIFICRATLDAYFGSIKELVLAADLPRYECVCVRKILKV